MPTDAPQPLNVPEIYQLLRRRRDAGFPCFMLFTLTHGSGWEILAVQPRPESVQIAFSMLLPGLGGEKVYATIDAPFGEMPDDPDAVLPLDVLVIGLQDEATRSREWRYDDIPFFRDWRTRWPRLCMSVTR